MRIYLFIAALAGAVTWFMTPVIRQLAFRIGAVGEVRARDVHTVPTPRIGGLAMLSGVAVAFLIASRTPWVENLFEESHQLWAVLVGAILISLVGVADDLWDLDWMLKMSGQLLISLLVSWGGVRIVSLPLGNLYSVSTSWSIAISAFLLVASINAVNFVDGLDGLASGIVAIGGIAFAIYSYMLARSTANFASVALIIDVVIVGVCIGFLLHNWHPASIFMGDSGSMLLGFMVTCASIVMTGRLDPNAHHVNVYLPVFIPILLPILVLFLPVLDMVLAITRRVSKGLSPMHPDRMHLHHRMLRIGHSVRWAVGILWSWAALISFSSVLLLFFRMRYVFAFFVCAAAVLTVVTLFPYYRTRFAEIRAQRAQEETA
ncbi:undecaprenyl-phosphate alpha-N-acetylglucosaminyl 1-phosphate transferase [Alloscardovia macacae]|uniref:Undecaprenyl-phosphate alpha-N-acetylglucosaminyl 1-phosphate transferase n=1 Tax=Alloscardovia macacae TaxID=1160091 RepID=A0A1Y2SVB4_9BIFI|nr:MraY family glycosyltransferase [Alloscardovia macacae]OTA26116.1 undecaprenyl-phosphate alpha-N-acetylglucosaminyl 1-phosphate transferase [Alloscardovia macacae]OTA28583.1 undecaprenyl-phosphate alpha-N-acetylglucosaminyl 1-phosphate transferase [Alloscardovia macacae]